MSSMPESIWCDEDDISLAVIGAVVVVGFCCSIEGIECVCGGLSDVFRSLSKASTSSKFKKDSSATPEGNKRKKALRRRLIN